MIKLKNILLEIIVDKSVLTNPNFIRWFGKSKVTRYINDYDDIVVPKILYHGTKKSGFKSFEKDKIGSSTDEGYLGAGFYFSSHPDNTDAYAGLEYNNGKDGLYNKSYKEGAGMYPVFLKIENPVPNKEMDYAVEKFNSNGAKMTEYFISKGYDGIIASGEYVVFEPTQIKSAIGNNGKFDPNNPDITK